MRLMTTLSLGAALAAMALAATAQPLRLAAVPAVPPPNTAAAPAPVAAAPAPAAALDDPPTSAPPASAAPAAAPAATSSAAAPATPTTVASAAPAKLDPNPASDGIAATVDEVSISDYELGQRIAMHVAVLGFQPNADDLQRIRKQILEQLEEEKIQLAEANRQKLTVSPVEINRRIETFAKSKNVTVKDLTDVLARAGTSIDVLRSELIAASAWSKTLAQQFGNQVVVTPAQIADALRRASEGANRTHYRVYEIFLQVDSPAQNDEVQKQMAAIEAQVRAGTATFLDLAQRYSRNPSAAQGGDIGWVYDGQLDPELNTELATMKPGDMSHPVRGRGGWFLLLLRERQEPLGTNVSVPVAVTPSGPPGTLPLARLLLPVGAGSSQVVIDNNMKAAAQIRAAVSSCEVMEKIAQDPSLRGSMFQKLGVTEISGLSEQMQKALAGTTSGEVAAPFVSDAGVEIIARCDARPPPPRVAFKLPTEEEIHEQLFSDQIAELAQKYMRDLKRNANIQERGGVGSILDAALIP